jgi:hypothetical protein
MIGNYRTFKNATIKENQIIGDLLGFEVDRLGVKNVVNLMAMRKG